MGERGRRSLIILDGSLPGLVCAALGEHPEELVGWFPGAGIDLGEGELGEAHQQAAQRQGELTGLGEAVIAGRAGTRSEHAKESGWIGGSTAGIDTSIVLLRACAEAARRGCGRVVWGVHCGSDLDGVFDGAERAGLIGRLASIGLPGSMEGLRVETPLLDMSETQIAELALDLDVPVGSCWWAGDAGRAIEGSAVVRGRWERALAGAGKLRGLAVSVG